MCRKFKGLRFASSFVTLTCLVVRLRQVCVVALAYFDVAVNPPQGHNLWLRSNRTHR